MAIKTVDLGPGSLTLGTGPGLEVSGQLTSCSVETSESVATTDPVPVLSGEEKAGTDKVTHTQTIKGNLFQDLDAAGVVAYSFANAGLWKACTFTPNTVKAAKVDGEVCLVPITVGGDVTGVVGRRGDPLRSDFSWRFRPTTGKTVAQTFTPGV